MPWKAILKSIFGGEKSPQEIMRESIQKEEEWKARLGEVQRELNRGFQENRNIEKHFAQGTAEMAQLKGERHLKKVK